MKWQKRLVLMLGQVVAVALLVGAVEAVPLITRVEVSLHKIICGALVLPANAPILMEANMA